jgi:predicted Zn-dependent peptidase
MQLKIKKWHFIAFLLFLGQSVFAQEVHNWQEGKSGGYTYKYVSGDPMQARFYTLENGLTVILSENAKEPRIAAKIAVRTGSNNDPKDHTGLAHYLEHLLFKGTDKFGTQNWEKEKPYLEKITALYEVYNQTKDSAKRKEIYKEIDKLSGEASQYSIGNEYDKLMASIGSQGTNAHTSVEETVYHEDIPSSAIDKFLTIQAERFRNPIFRIFHTELEAVYEEKNISIDNDGRKIQESMLSNVFPSHNYGQQSTIGTIEHLKNPSLVAIRDYYDRYYVPNNMAIILAGDFDSDEMIKKVDSHFAYMQAKPVQEYTPPAEKPLAGPIVKEVFGPSAESMRIAYRVGAENSREALMIDLVSSILSNGKAGLIDLNLNKQQKVLGAGTAVWQFKDYGIFMGYASPKQGQPLEETKDLILAEIENIKNGDFDEELVNAIIANAKLSEILGLESNRNRAAELADAFILNQGKGWDRSVNTLQELSKVNKTEIMNFANNFFGDNYVIIYKRQGEDTGIVKVEKPEITPVEMNAGIQSEYVTHIVNMSDNPVSPQWMDFDRDIQKDNVNNLDVLYIQNENNDLFRQYYYFDIGSHHSKLLPLAASYLSFLGTPNYSSAEISKQFYQLASTFSISTQTENTSISIQGLKENYKESVALFEHLIKDAKVDEEALVALKDRLLKSRSDSKLNKGTIMAALTSYATYGAKNPFNDVLTDDEIQKITGEELLYVLRSIFDHKNTLIYYGPESLVDYKKSIAKLHSVPASFKTIPAPVIYTKVTQSDNQVLFADYKMVQADIRWVRNASTYNPAKTAEISLFNTYFGGGMGSVVFQTIRESKALAYSTYAFLGTPAKLDDSYSILAFVGTQADKSKDAIKGMNELLNELPNSEKGIQTAKVSMKNDIETERVIEDKIIFSYLAALKKGLKHDIRKDVYDKINTLTFNDIQKLHQEEIANKAYTYCIVASDENINDEELKAIGQVKKLSLEELFGY